MGPIWSEGWFWAAAALALAALVAILQVIGRRRNTARDDRRGQLVEYDRRATAPRGNLRQPRPWPKYAPAGIGPGRNVVGREDEVMRLRNALQEGAVVVKGPGGIGKSTLARYFAETYSREYYGIWWLPAETRQDLIGELCKLAGHLDIPAGMPSGKRAAAALHRITDDIRPWLLIYDNAVGPDRLKHLIPHRDNIHVIVTSREGGWPETKFHRHAIGALDFSTRDSPATALLMQEAQRAADPAGARALAEALGGLPLALVNAGAYLRDAPDIGFAACAKDLQGAIARKPSPGGDYPDHVFGAVSLSLEGLSPASPEAVQVANILAFWAPEGLVPGLFTPIATQSLDQEHRKPIPGDLWPALLDADALTKAFTDLTRRSILERRGEGEAAHFAMHRQTGAVIRARLRTERHGQWRKAAATVLAAAYPSGKNGPLHREGWPLCAALTPHVLALAEHGEDSATAGYLYNQAALYLDRMHQDLPALMLARASLWASDRRLDPRHRDICVGYTTLATMRRIRHRPELAEKLLARAAEIAEQNPEFGAARASVFSNHGGALKNRGHQVLAVGKMNEAADWFSRAARRYSQALLLDRRRGDRQAVAAHLNDLGTLRQLQGRSAAATRLGRMALNIRREVLAPDDPQLATSLHNLATRLLPTPDWRQAEPLLDEARTIREASLAGEPRHPDRVVIAKFLTVAALMRGDRAKAVAIIDRYPEDIDLDKRLRRALNNHFRMALENGRVEPEVLAEIFNLMGLTKGAARSILPEAFHHPRPR